MEATAGIQLATGPQVLLRSPHLGWGRQRKPRLRGVGWAWAMPPARGPIYGVGAADTRAALDEGSEQGMEDQEGLGQLVWSGRRPLGAEREQKRTGMMAQGGVGDRTPAGVKGWSRSPQSTLPVQPGQHPVPACLLPLSLPGCTCLY